MAAYSEPESNSSALRVRKRTRLQCFCFLWLVLTLSLGAAVGQMNSASGERLPTVSPGDPVVGLPIATAEDRRVDLLLNAEAPVVADADNSESLPPSAIPAAKVTGQNAVVAMQAKAFTSWDPHSPIAIGSQASQPAAPSTATLGSMPMPVVVPSVSDSALDLNALPFHTASLWKRLPSESLHLKTAHERRHSAARAHDASQSRRHGPSLQRQQDKQHRLSPSTYSHSTRRPTILQQQTGP